MNCAKETTAHEPCDARRCPLCGGANDCRLCDTGAYKGPCWCEATQIPDALLARVPEALRNRACICKQCVEAFHRGEARSALECGDLSPLSAGDLPPSSVQVTPPSQKRAAERGAASPTSRRSQESCDRSQHSRAGAPSFAQGDFYLDDNQLMVFTAAYHLRRGYCCENGCRHCPYARAQ